MPPFRRLLKTQGRRTLQKPIPIKGLRRNNFTFWRERRPPPRPYGLRPVAPLALLLAPYMQPGMTGPPDPVLVARA